MKKDAMPCILVTGGAGFIGSHTCVTLLEQDYRVVIVDNLYNSNEVALQRIAQIVGDEHACNLSFYKVDVCDKNALTSIFNENKIDAVIHFAGYKAVGESCSKPLEYYTNNLTSTLVLCEVMREHGCKKLIFSSSATVYGDPDSLPLEESAQKKNATNPYGWTKWMIEQILTDIACADHEWDIVLLRYFNPIGAHQSGLIGEDPQGIPNNLVPYVSQTAIGLREAVHVFGNDYDTPDGTGIRDYIHVVDLAEGHVAALKWMDGHTGIETFNLGTGSGNSVLDIIHAFEDACGHEIAYVIEGRRPGDIASSYADPRKAQEVLGWKARFSLSDMCRDSWKWQTQNPHGYNA